MPRLNNIKQSFVEMFAKNAINFHTSECVVEK